jgi:hypothetical protein
LTNVTFSCCNFGTAQAASQLLAAFHTNTTVSDLTIAQIDNLKGAALGACLSGLLQNMTQLQRLDCYGYHLRVEGVRAVQPGLQSNRTLKELTLDLYTNGNDGIRLLADALAGNTTMDALSIVSKYLSSNSLDDITRLIESTQLQTIHFDTDASEELEDDNKALRFAATLRHAMSSVQKLPWVKPPSFSLNIRVAAYASITNSLARNRQLNRVNLLMEHPQQQQQQQRQRNAAATTMMLKVSHKAIATFATVPDNAGASAIFKLFQARSALLEKRLQRPAPAAAVAGTAAGAASASQDFW